jgi:hypothetical protein
LIDYHEQHRYALRAAGPRGYRELELWQRHEQEALEVLQRGVAAVLANVRRALKPAAPS